MIEFCVVVAVDSKMGIGKDGRIPWNLPSDLSHFKRVTSDLPGKNMVIMGRKTWESLPEKRRPLPGRINVVLSRNPGSVDGVGIHVCKSLDDALRIEADNVFVIGGAALYAEAMERPECKRLYVTRVDEDFRCDVSFPVIGDDFRVVKTDKPRIENGIVYRFEEYERVNTGN